MLDMCTGPSLSFKAELGFGVGSKVREQENETLIYIRLGHREKCAESGCVDSFKCSYVPNKQERKRGLQVGDIGAGFEKSLEVCGKDK